MDRLNRRWAAWGALYLAASAAALYSVIRLAGVFDGACDLAAARGALVEELRGQLGPIDLDGAAAADVEGQGADETAPVRPGAAQDGPGA